MGPATIYSYVARLSQYIVLPLLIFNFPYREELLCLTQLSTTTCSCAAMPRLHPLFGWKWKGEAQPLMSWNRQSPLSGPHSNSRQLTLEPGLATSSMPSMERSLTHLNPASGFCLFVGPMGRSSDLLWGYQTFGSREVVIPLSGDLHLMKTRMIKL